MLVQLKGRKQAQPQGTFPIPDSEWCSLGSGKPSLIIPSQTRCRVLPANLDCDWRSGATAQRAGKGRNATFTEHPLQPSPGRRLAHPSELLLRPWERRWWYQASGRPGGELRELKRVVSSHTDGKCQMGAQVCLIQSPSSLCHFESDSVPRRAFASGQTGTYFSF